MVDLPLTLKKISNFLEKLPGIGQKTANRLSFFLLQLPEEELIEVGQYLINLKKKIKLCQQCFNFTEKNLCSICQDERRDKQTITVVETVADLLSLENGNIYQGVYHVLHGRIDPLNRVGPEDIKINSLIERIKSLAKKNISINEIILATNADMEGEATAFYIKNKLIELKSKLAPPHNKFKITRLAYGLPIGANVEFADYMTLKKAIEGRIEY